MWSYILNFQISFWNLNLEFVLVKTLALISGYVWSISIQIVSCQAKTPEKAGFHVVSEDRDPHCQAKFGNTLPGKKPTHIKFHQN